jgi:peptide/nickel transport system substrate-binding protein
MIKSTRTLFPASNIRTSRRAAVAGAAATVAALALSRSPGAAAGRQTPISAESLLPKLVIDLAGAPASIDPALAYAPRDWSIVHAVYDSPLAIDAAGAVVPLAAESFAAVDDTTWELRLLPGMIFHDGTPVTTAAVARSLDHINDSESDAAGLFAGVTIEIVDDLTCRILVEAPSPWLPAQIAVYLALIPESASPEAFLTAPIGSGPYRFESEEPGSSITLVRHSDWVSTGVKGWPIAEQVVYRFVPESATRLADLATGAAHIITEIPHDQLDAISSAGATAVEVSIVGTHFIRIAADVEPLRSPEARQALNHAIDVETIAQALVSTKSHRLASLYPDERALGFDESLTPFAYDPALAQELLAQAEVGALDLILEVTTGARLDIAEAIAAQLADVGISVTVQVSDYGTFNATWSEPTAPALRLVSWAPLYDPQSLLGLVFGSHGYLSRIDSPEIDALIAEGAGEPDPEARHQVYTELGRVMQEDPPAVFLWNLTSGYGVSPEITSWEPRGDDYVLPLSPGAAG